MLSSMLTPSYFLAFPIEGKKTGHLTSSLCVQDVLSVGKQGDQSSLMGKFSGQILQRKLFGDHCCSHLKPYQTEPINQR